MNSKRKVVDQHAFAGREWSYAFRELPGIIKEGAARRVILKKEQAFTKMAKAWNSRLNSEWLVRTFYSAKMILSASLMLASLEYCRSRNVRICIPYLQYYSLLYVLKALVLSLPSQPWRNGELISQTHKKTIDISCHVVREFDKELGERLRETVLRLKAIRELISYRAPSSGGTAADPLVNVIALCALPVELAQVMSELLQRAIDKHVPPQVEFSLDDDILAIAYSVEIKGNVFDDKEDGYRIDYLARKHPRPTSIHRMMTEGHVEDFFGSWCSDKPQAGMFDPDANWQILFDVP